MKSLLAWFQCWNGDGSIEEAVEQEERSRSEMGVVMVYVSRWLGNNSDGAML